MYNCTINLRVLISFFACILCFYPAFARTVIINNQSEFDNVSRTLKEVILETDKDINVVIKPGQYEYSNMHIQLCDIIAPDKSIYFFGDNVTLVPKGRIYRNGDKYEGDFSVNNSWMCDGTDVENWSDVRYADGLVDILDSKTGKCRLKGKDFFSDKGVVENAYILITSWYQSKIYKINKLDGYYIYFTADDLSRGRGVGEGMYNINNDYYYNNTYPRYKLCNVNVGDNCLKIINGRMCLPKNVNFVREGMSGYLMILQSSRLKSVGFNGIKVWGGGNSDNPAAFLIRNVKCSSIGISNCEFVGFRNPVISVKSTSNVNISYNSFYDCYTYVIVSDNGSTGTFVKENSFCNIGKRCNNTFCVSCCGKDFIVSGNKFLDYGYGAIETGIYFKTQKDYLCTGVIENNNLSFTDGYKKSIHNQGLMDSGAIYLSTKMDGVVIRNNRIDNYSGAGDNRGIFCDDGAFNFDIYGNVITGIDNSFCIDSWRNGSVEEAKTHGTGITQSNVNISIHDNVIDGGIRFNGNENANNNCYLGNNYCLTSEDECLPTNDINNVNILGDTIALEYTGKKRGRLGVARVSYKALKHSSAWKEVKKFVIKNKKK